MNIHTGKNLLCSFLLSIFCFVLFSAGIQAGEFKWARAKFRIAEENLLNPSSIKSEDAMYNTNGMWNIALKGDQKILEDLEKYISIKVNKQVFIVDFKNINELCKYPFIFMHASGTIVLNEQEKKNIREYINKGGFIFAEDCTFKGWLKENETLETPDYRPSFRYTSDTFFKGFKKMVEKELFPGKEMVLLPKDHDIYRCLYKFPEGLPYLQGQSHGGYGYFDEKKRLRIFLSSNDIHCGWIEGWFNKTKCTEAVQMAMNIVLYAFSH